MSGIPAATGPHFNVEVFNRLPLAVKLNTLIDQADRRVNKLLGGSMRTFDPITESPQLKVWMERCWRFDQALFSLNPLKREFYLIAAVSVIGCAILIKTFPVWLAAASFGLVIPALMKVRQTAAKYQNYIDYTQQKKLSHWLTERRNRLAGIVSLVGGPEVCDKFAQWRGNVWGSPNSQNFREVVRWNNKPCPANIASGFYERIHLAFYVQNRETGERFLENIYEAMLYGDDKPGDMPEESGWCRTGQWLANAGGIHEFLRDEEIPENVRADLDRRCTIFSPPVERNFDNPGALPNKDRIPEELITAPEHWEQFRQLFAGTHPTHTLVDYPANRNDAITADLRTIIANLKK
jgi:hypothetical protein